MVRGGRAEAPVPRSELSFPLDRSMVNFKAASNMGHVHIGRRSGQSLARERHTGKHEEHRHTRTTFRYNAAEGRQCLLPTVMREKPLQECE
jgi:hypothetical protein